MATDRTIRRNGKWAKVSGSRGAWKVAQGWNGQIVATRVFTYPTKDSALICANGYLND